jgi:hypothetical protein
MWDVAVCLTQMKLTLASSSLNRGSPTATSATVGTSSSVHPPSGHRTAIEHEGGETPVVDSCTGASQWETHPHDLSADVGAKRQQGAAELGGTHSTPVLRPTPQQLQLETKPKP